ncbi:sensor histidine kinase [Ureibacillus endophyticus]|uniref:histidine kinase n=1 Tax=Ureibacillus endophyticus TaxID=1978490 RepID=A0A494Z782_9BACL|nr:HAMP domain-containing sensor histidine kinase [Lysinibacillus endophyticus]RKQ18458.1 sensor histidine kinase [Lysinibacillus endophyticus]
MFNQTRKKLSLFYASCFFLFFLFFILILYFSIVHLVKQGQIEELESYYHEQKHDLYKHFNDQFKLFYEPNRTYFYYIYTPDHQLVHGDESYQGLSREIEKIYGTEVIKDSQINRVKFEGHQFLLLSKPISNKQKIDGYMILGKNITSQYHFIKNMVLLLIVLTVIFSIFIAFLSYFMAGKAMIPIRKSFDKQMKFVSDASHELRTPLSIFYSSLDILDEDEGENLSSFGKELVEDLKHESILMKELLEKLLFLARYDQKNWSNQKEIIQLSELLTSIGSKFERTLPDSIRLQCTIEKGIEFECDRTQIQQLVYILLDNASRYTEEGEITLSLKKNNDDYIVISVKDTGVGISKEELPNIFDRFYRSDEVRKRDGTGLGLSIANAITELHGGKITVESELGKGSTFSIRLPFEKGVS